MTWFAYTVQPQGEGKARDILEQWGFGVSVPTEIIKRKRARSLRRYDVEVPLIRGYVFVDVPDDLGWWHVLNFREIMGVVGMAGEAMPIDGNWINRVSQPRDKTDSIINFEAGTPVQVIGGPAEGHQAKVIECSKDFAKVYFDGSNFPVTVRTEMLERV